MKCREHDWTIEWLHADCRPNGGFAPRVVDRRCRKCGEWRRGPFDAEAWRAHYTDVRERMEWDALLSQPAHQA